MGSVPANCMYNDLYKLHACVPLAGYILLMTPQLEVLKHLGLDDNRSAELKRFYDLLLFGMMFK